MGKSGGVVPYVLIPNKGILFILGLESKGKNRGKWASFSGGLDNDGVFVGSKREFKEETMGIFDGYYDKFKYDSYYTYGGYRGYMVNVTPFFKNVIGPKNEELKIRVVKSFLQSYNNLYSYMSKNRNLKGQLNKHSYWEKSRLGLYTFSEMLSGSNMLLSHKNGMIMINKREKVGVTLYRNILRNAGLNTSGTEHSIKIRCLSFLKKSKIK